MKDTSRPTIYTRKQGGNMSICNYTFKVNLLRIA